MCEKILFRLRVVNICGQHIAKRRELAFAKKYIDNSVESCQDITILDLVFIGSMLFNFKRSASTRRRCMAPAPGWPMTRAE